MKIDRISAKIFKKGDLAITKSGDGVLVLSDGASTIWDGIKPRYTNKNITFIKVDMNIPEYAQTAKIMMRTYNEYIKNHSIVKRTRQLNRKEDVI